MDQLILVPLGEEWDAMGPILSRKNKVREEPASEVTYYSWSHPVKVERGEFDEPISGNYLTAAASIGRAGQTNAGNVATKAVDKWKPARVILLGIAGGIDREWVKLGDVVAPDLVFGYAVEAVDGNPPRHEYRPDGYQAGAVLVDQVRALKNDKRAYKSWQEKCFKAAPSDIVRQLATRRPKLHVIPMASGNQVVRSAEQGRLLRASISPLIGAVEMEAAGVFHAAWRGASRPDVLMVRGISDLADENKTKLERSTHDSWREFAAGNAARLVRALWERRTLPIAAPPISPEFKINVNLASKSREHFLKKDPATGRSEITISYGEIRSQTLAFIDFLRRRGATPKAGLTVRAQLKSGKPAPDFRLQVVTEDGDQRTISKAISGSKGKATFVLSPTENDVRVHLMVASRAELLSLRFDLKDCFGRSTDAAWKRP